MIGRDQIYRKQIDSNIARKTEKVNKNIETSANYKILQDIFCMDLYVWTLFQKLMNSKYTTRMTTSISSEAQKNNGFSFD